MPRERASFEYRVFHEDKETGEEWRVEKLGRVQLEPRRDVRVVLFVHGKFSGEYAMTPHTRKGRTDYRVKIEPFGNLYVHRVAAYAWRMDLQRGPGIYEDLDGEQIPLPEGLDWEGFQAYCVDHGAGTERILLSELLICTRERNDQLHCARMGWDYDPGVTRAAKKARTAA